MHDVQTQYLPIRRDAARLVSALLVDESPQPLARIATPSPCAQLVARFGPTVPGGVDVHLLGPQRRVRRKHVGGGHRAILLRLRPGMQPAIAGVAPSESIGSAIAIDDLWGANAANRLRAQLAAAMDANAAAALLQAAIVEQASSARGASPATPRLAFALARLQASGVADVARAVGVSERQLRREFRDLLGLSPKAVARLDRFARAVRAGQSIASPSWAAVAADAGYYDQAHMIADFKAIAGVTPRALLAELRVATPIGGSGFSRPPPDASATLPTPARRTPRR
ncbi:helix-turn-helix domain-containing protein [Luteimonas aestuarii]|nr:helix-turn-helix domain-containing protein [Luteimonas aestuarii]